MKETVEVHTILYVGAEDSKVYRAVKEKVNLIHLQRNRSIQWEKPCPGVPRSDQQQGEYCLKQS